MLALTLPAFAQKPDSLLAVLDTAKNDKKVKTLNELFRFYIASDPMLALGYTREALSLATEIDDKRGIAASYNNLGVAYRAQGAYDRALNYYLEALKLFEELKNEEGIASLKNNIATIYAIKKDFASASANLDQAYEILSKTPDKKRLAGLLNNMGNLYSDINETDKATKFFNEAFDISTQSGMEYSDPLLNLGNLNFRNGNLPEAVEYYKRALTIAKNQGDKFTALDVVTNLGIALSKSRQTKEAESFLQEALQMATELNANGVLPSIYKATAENLFNQGKGNDAYKTLLLYDEAREKISGEESTRRIAQMEMIVKFEQKQRDLELLKKESEVKNLELKNTRLFVIVVILGILTILGLINLLFLDRKRKLINN